MRGELSAHVRAGTELPSLYIADQLVLMPQSHNSFASARSYSLRSDLGPTRNPRLFQTYCQGYRPATPYLTVFDGLGLPDTAYSWACCARILDVPPYRSQFLVLVMGSPGPE